MRVDLQAQFIFDKLDEISKKCGFKINGKKQLLIYQILAGQQDTIPRARWDELRAWVERAAEITPQTNEQTIPWRQAMRDVLRTMKQLERGDDDN